tara:strand:- start:11 stop:487 length:477 start_codon:yes stop_codon:yes gene_type:complete
MKTLLINIFLAFAWIFLTGDLAFINFAQGMVIAYIVLYIARGVHTSEAYFTKLPTIISFIFYFMKELIVANFMVAYDIITPEHKMRPAIIAFPLTAESAIEITILANLITLTPGTLSIDVSESRKVLYIHTMYLKSTPEQFVEEIRNGLEKKLLEVTR